MTRSTYVSWLKLFAAVGRRDLELAVASCPECAEARLKVQYVGADDRLGYGAMWCQNCWHGVWISRLRVPEGWDFASFEEAEGGLIPSFMRIEPKEANA